MSGKPSEDFLAVLSIAYKRAKKARPVVTPSDIWDEVVHICWAELPDGFRTLFTWDKRTGKQNRIGTIIECIEAGYLPGARLVDGRVEERP